VLLCCIPNPEQPWDNKMILLLVSAQDLNIFWGNLQKASYNYGRRAASANAKTIGDHDQDKDTTSSNRLASPIIPCPNCKDPSWSCTCCEDNYYDCDDDFAFLTETGACNMDELFCQNIQQQLARGAGCISFDFNILDLNKENLSSCSITFSSLLYTIFLRSLPATH
jgi:hypothetical protein